MSRPMKTKGKKKDEFVYLVYCNPENQLVYGIYKSKHDAVRYACYLIRYRKDRAKSKGQQFGYYHFQPLPQQAQLNWMKDPSSLYYHDVTLFTACISLPDEKDETWGDDACHVRVVRRILS